MLTDWVDRIISRPQTAPTRTLTGPSDFRTEELNKLIEHGLAHLGNFAHPYEPQFDVDSEQGQAACKGFLSTAEKIQQMLGCKTACRNYRDNFSKAYKILYKDKQLCYLIEILDSAQECELIRRAMFVC